VPPWTTWDVQKQSNQNLALETLVLQVVALVQTVHFYAMEFCRGKTSARKTWHHGKSCYPARIAKALVYCSALVTYKSTVFIFRWVWKWNRFVVRNQLMEDVLGLGWSLSRVWVWLWILSLWINNQAISVKPEIYTNFKQTE
jgi:hypothetical protein